ncbi:MAG: hypothetical protein ACI30D_00950 [Muribaculaceae bacterium]
MNDKLFLIAIGGTGMRCLESFVHLCAAGIFDNRTIDILTLDTDQSNGNKGRVEELIELYNKVKTNDPSNFGGEQRADTFFSAKLNLYRFFTDYSTDERRTLAALEQATNNLTPEQRRDNEDLANLMFDRDTVQSFQLDHGYRAQTHLGSMLMYHGIIEAARNAKAGGKDVKPQEKELKEFLELLNKNANQARVFVFGSVFGGTGASSIPVIPVALQEALRIISGGNNVLNLNKVKFGSTLLTDYFTFKAPTDDQRKRDRVIADSSNFALNSQAALNFYNNDSTVKRSYKRLYHIGWPTTMKINYSEGQTGDVVTGGHDQKNACHIAELMCAAAAYDFFTTDKFDNEQAEYFFRTVKVNDNGALELTGASFVGDERGEMFENKLGAFLSLAHLMLSKFEGGFQDVCGTLNFLGNIESNYKITNYSSITDQQANEIDDYLKEFAYKFVKGLFIPGWIYQIQRSVGDGNFLFAPEAFQSDVAAMPDIDAGAIFLDDAHNWEKGGLFGSAANRRFDKLMQIVRSADSEPDEKQASTVKEQFLAHLYNAITIAQNYQ